MYTHLNVPFSVSFSENAELVQCKYTLAALVALEDTLEIFDFVDV